MPNYRRAIQPGGTFFLTLVTECRAPIFAAGHARVLLRNAIDHCREVRHVDCPHAWPHSSFHGFVRQGHYERDWCCQCGGRTVIAMRFEQIAKSAGE